MGGQPPLDPKSNASDAQTPVTERYRKEPDTQQALASTVALADVDAAQFHLPPAARLGTT